MWHLGTSSRKTRRYDGSMGKSDRAFVFGVLGLIYAVNGSLHSLFWWVANIVIILLIATCIKRVKMAWQK